MTKSRTILVAENISKQYRLGLVGTGTISHDLNRWWYRIRGKQDPYLKVGETNDRSTKGESNYVWALEDINFEVKEGEVLGIIGKNGAGKSTLLKILSRVTNPTTGEIKTKGRIASLLEVGTGFHPELTGRENIYLNGAILGMTKAEIKLKEDEIIEFSGCERYVDTPVKRYSSGMRVRLAFAVAAHLEPDILVIDEVLAVGDAEFQKKAIGKMQDISNTDGRTVLFVSHNMAAVENLCSRLMVLENGKSIYCGDVQEGIIKYLNLNKGNNEVFDLKNTHLIIKKFYLTDNSNNKISAFSLGKKSFFVFQIELFKPINKLVFKIEIKDDRDNIILILNNFHTNQVFNIEELSFNVKCEIETLQIFPGNYKMNLEIIDFDNKLKILEVEDFYQFHIDSGDFYGTGIIPRAKHNGVFLTNHSWSLTNDIT
ncbi:ABC transporter ATP-binding protein [Psychroserpens mesophilus]|uniref:ABC transporter ATP-binding protein n=1 Tax=Psychroserpens mesophilus TaxID=325473 RepID=UPI003F496412